MTFTRTLPRVPLDDFHPMTDSFLNRLRMDSVQLREDWIGRNYADDRVDRRFLASPRADGKFVYEFTESSVRFPSYLDGFTSDKTLLDSSRLATLLDRVKNLAQESNPDPAARIAVLKEVARREEMIRALESGGGSPAPAGRHRRRSRPRHPRPRRPVRRLQTHARRPAKDAA